MINYYHGVIFLHIHHSQTMPNLQMREKQDCHCGLYINPETEE